ncbi:adenylosuccinate synthetase [Batrachochytrium salamandrivorans]|nr:adenylosuccinate synthetase [Batrachochytrium salamandrivorans]
MHDQIIAGKRILVEGANAPCWISIWVHIHLSPLPIPTLACVCTGLGLPPNKIGKVIALPKHHYSVGAGPFPTEQLNSVGEHLQNVGQEFGTTTGQTSMWMAGYCCSPILYNDQRIQQPQLDQNLTFLTV